MGQSTSKAENKQPTAAEIVKRDIIKSNREHSDLIRETEIAAINKSVDDMVAAFIVHGKACQSTKKLLVWFNVASVTYPVGMNYSHEKNKFIDRLVKHPRFKQEGIRVSWNPWADDKTIFMRLR